MDLVGLETEPSPAADDVRLPVGGWPHFYTFIVDAWPGCGCFFFFFLVVFFLLPG